MPTIYTFEKEKLRPIVDLFLRTGANFDEKFPSAFKRPMRLIMQENIPMVLLSDGFNYIEALFTKESINDFRKNFSHLKFSNLREKIIYVKKWSLMLRQRSSDKQHCTHHNLTVIFTVENFKLINQEIPALRQLNVDNLHENEALKTMLD